jgi:hypothetical protein
MRGRKPELLPIPPPDVSALERIAHLDMYWLSVNWKIAFGALAGFRDYGDR